MKFNGFICDRCKEIYGDDKTKSGNVIIDNVKYDYCPSCVGEIKVETSKPSEYIPYYIRYPVHPYPYVEPLYDTDTSYPRTTWSREFSGEALGISGIITYPDY